MGEQVFLHELQSEVSLKGLAEEVQFLSGKVDLPPHPACHFLEVDSEDQLLLLPQLDFLELQEPKSAQT
jgi:hypothetical protein